MSEEFVKNILVSNGFEVKKIEESGTKTPDFFAKFNNENYIIEVKDKNDSDELKKDLEKIDEGQILDIEFDLQNTGTIDKIISKAKAQIKQIAENDDDIFRVIWFHSSAIHYEAYKEQIITSLYGTVVLWDLNSDKDVGKCYYFNNSKFFRYRNEIDAVIVADDKSAQLCLNTFSPRYEQIKQSELVKVFKEGTLDPFQEEAKKRGYVADTDLDRRDIKEVLNYVDSKYCTNFKIFPMKYYSGMMTVFTN